ncbi:TcpQ domain-containing protein [Erwinia tasmaniensis]|nr:TcpQ domain-containing protein [Erwinia tasmaniensis]
MNKIILAAMSAGILSGCSSAPPLATPKGEFVDMNTEITSLLPHTEPVYIGEKITNVTSPSLITIGAKTGNKDVRVSGKKEIDKKEVVNSGLLLTAKPKEKAVPDKLVLKATPVPLKGFDTPVVMVSPKASPGKTLSPVTASGSNPFSEIGSVKLLTDVASKPAFPVIPVKIAPAMKVWEIKKGTTLITGFTEWVVKEKCPSGDGKWKIQRLTDTDYPIDYPLTITAADFETATSELFKLYQHAQMPLDVDGFRPQCLIIISNRK